MKIKGISTNVLIIGLFFSLSGFYQNPNDWKTIFSKIKEEVDQHSQVYENLKKSTETIGHRLTGSLNGKKAEQHTFDLFQSYGYEVEFEEFEVEAWARESVSLSIAPENSDNFRDLEVVSLAMTPLKSDISGKIVHLGNGLEGDFEKHQGEVKGKIVLMNIGLIDAPQGTRNFHRSEKVAIAIEYGAIGVIFINTVKGHVLLTGTASVTSNLISIPAVCISLEDGMELRKWLKEKPDLLAEIHMRNTSDLIKARNVIARLPGTDRKLSKEKIILGGHLDSWDLAQGAIDNGIGSYSVIDIARTFKALNLNSKRTIEFVMFMGEEEGLLGSKAFMKKRMEEGNEGEIVYMINLDMTNNVYGFNAGGRKEMSEIIHAIGKTIQMIDKDYENGFSNSAGLHSDHQTFMMEGITTGWPMGRLEPSVGNCYHANCDSFELVNKKELEKNVKYTGMFLYALANLDQFPAKKLNFDETRAFFIQQNLKRELELGNEWKWE